LIELLTVIAIISILAAMLLPALSKAKSEGSEGTDLNNLKQIMVALNIYADDHADALPAPNWDSGGFHGPNGNGTFAGWLYQPELEAAGTSRYVLTNGVFWPLLRQPKTLICPSDNLRCGTGRPTTK